MFNRTADAFAWETVEREQYFKLQRSRGTWFGAAGSAAPNAAYRICRRWKQRTAVFTADREDVLRVFALLKKAIAAKEAEGSAQLSESDLEQVINVALLEYSELRAERRAQAIAAIASAGNTLLEAAPPRLLPGERQHYCCGGAFVVLPTGEKRDAAVHVTNYRLQVTLAPASTDLQPSVLAFPTMALDVTKRVDGEQEYLKVLSKGVWGCRLAFRNPGELHAVHAVHQKLRNPSSLADYFASDYKRARVAEAREEGAPSVPDTGWELGDKATLLDELDRQVSALRKGIPETASRNLFRVIPTPASLTSGPDASVAANPGYSLPPYIIVPSAVDDATVRDAMLFRSRGRIPSISWIHPTTGAVLGRSSMPRTGLLRNSSVSDERLLQTFIFENNWAQTPAIIGCETNPPNFYPACLWFVDCRGQVAASANMTKGGGYENVKQYPNSKILFLGLENIHSITRSFRKLRKLFAASNTTADGAPTLKEGTAGFLGLVEDSQWLLHIQRIIWGAVKVVDLLEGGSSVLVHCTDGWDRTPQVVTLTMLLLDPFYRTFEGFIRLVDREWLQHGHKFGHRCSNGALSSSTTGDDTWEDWEEEPSSKDKEKGEEKEKVEERSPIFVQWLDAVHQVMLQFPQAFEFTPALLCELADHCYSCRYGTFLGNCATERLRHDLRNNTWSIWTDLRLAVLQERVSGWSGVAQRIVLPNVVDSVTLNTTTSSSGQPNEQLALPPREEHVECESTADMGKSDHQVALSPTHTLRNSFCVTPEIQHAMAVSMAGAPQATQTPVKGDFSPDRPALRRPVFCSARRLYNGSEKSVTADLVGMEPLCPITQEGCAVVPPLLYPFFAAITDMPCGRRPLRPSWYAKWMTVWDYFYRHDTTAVVNQAQVQVPLVALQGMLLALQERFDATNAELAECKQRLQEAGNGTTQGSAIDSDAD
eukprot:TRINITY_DN19966_c0_g1_i1.p1 TRINITY_DN19966_c0_g1~~TRINITY_DN19966_c0_g1_i1.p1  ORF type:complete len:937 (-),score=103.03 TRINITY_DN19966_c0_g1_i1:3-2813(-)